MKIPDSLKPKLILLHAGETIKRFPFVLLACLIAGSLLEFFERHEGEESQDLIKCLLTSFLLIPTFVSIRLLHERGEKWRQYLLLLIPVGFFVLTKTPDLQSTKFQFAQLFVATHVFAAIAPFLMGRRDGEFWEFNKTLFLRFILSSIYSSVLLTGLFVCMGALKGLFYLDITGSDFYTVFLISAFIFHPMHFLAGVPRSLDEVSEYPRPLQIFCQNLFIPLIGILGTILVVYSVTIAATMNWPKGLVSLLISTFSSLGLLSILLVDPLIRSGTGWFEKYARYFYVVMTGLSVVMFLAAMRRVSDYSITEERYFVLLIALWLFVIGLFFIFKPTRSIKIIPMSLFVVSLLSAYGPWSANSVALLSQKQRLENLLTKSGLLSQGKLVQKAGGLRPADEKEITSIINYLYDSHGKEAISSWMNSDDHGINRFYEEAGFSQRRWNYEKYWALYNNPPEPPIDVAGYSKLEQFLHSENAGSGGLFMKLTPKAVEFEIHEKKKIIPVEEFIKLGGINEKKLQINKQLTFKGGSGNKRWKIIIRSASGYLGTSQSDMIIQNLSGYLLY